MKVFEITLQEESPNFDAGALASLVTKTTKGTTDRQTAWDHPAQGDYSGTDRTMDMSTISQAETAKSFNKWKSYSGPATAVQGKTDQEAKVVIFQLMSQDRWARARAILRANPSLINRVLPNKVAEIEQKGIEQEKELGLRK